ncbi:MAG: TM2 domain-containing protein [Rhodothermales bacterium]
MSKVIRYMPELQGEEQVNVAQWMKGMTEEQAHHFAHVHRQRRKDDMVTLIMALVGFFGLAGIHRFYLGQVGMGLLYLFTGGFCAIGTIIDLFNHKNLTARYNIAQANEVAQLIKGAFPETKELEAPSKSDTEDAKD